MDEIRAEYERLLSLPSDAAAADKRRRGFDFERMLNNLFRLEELDPRTSFRAEGEQIDGSIHLDGRTYLLEAKWHADPLPASTLYQFKGKVDGKLTGTIGFFISMSGYSEDAVDALTLGKELNTILFDKRDLDAAIVRRSGFKNVLKLKLRKAAEEGVINYPMEGELVTAGRSQTVEIEHLRFDHATGGIVAARPVESAAADLFIICEGDSDRVAISELVERILADAGSTRSINVVVAMGKMTIPRIANALASKLRHDSKMLIVTDGDNDPNRTAAMLSNGLEFKEWVASIPNPSIETWLGLDEHKLRRVGAGSRHELMRQAARKLNISALRAQDDQFAKFYDAVLNI